MVFYGSKTRTLKKGQLTNINCPKCDTRQTIHYAVYGKYAYAYWIPLFPIGKTTIVKCNYCKNDFKQKELPEQTKQKFELETADTKYPIWYFSGLILLITAITTAFYLSKKDAENDKLYIQDPVVGDLYSIKSSKNEYYTSMRVTEVTTDSVFVVFNDYEIDRKSQIYKIDKTENYTTETDGYSKEEITSLFKTKFIFEVDRN